MGGIFKTVENKKILNQLNPTNTEEYQKWNGGSPIFHINPTTINHTHIPETALRRALTPRRIIADAIAWLMVYFTSLCSTLPPLSTLITQKKQIETISIHT